MSEHKHTPVIELAVRNALASTKVKHRLCMDFNTLDGMYKHFQQLLKEGMVHPASKPFLLAKDDGSTVWVVGVSKEKILGAH